MMRHIEPSFTVKPLGDSGALSVVIVPMQTPEGFPKGIFGFELRGGTSPQEALSIAKFLDENLIAFTHLAESEK